LFHVIVRLDSVALQRGGASLTSSAPIEPVLGSFMAAKSLRLLVAA
jgi:hypothetical protein